MVRFRRPVKQDLDFLRWETEEPEETTAMSGVDQSRKNNEMKKLRWLSRKSAETTAFV